MAPDQWVILALLASPLLILFRDAYNRRHEPRQLWLALALLAAILLNVAVTTGLAF